MVARAAFRSQFKADPIRSRVWVVTFALASVFAPLFLGAAVGAIASGQMEFTERGEFAGSYASGWINGLSIFCGFFTVGMCAYTSATYMIRESKLAGQEELVFVWRTRALVTGVIMGVLAVGGLVLVAFAYPELWQGLFGRSWWLILASIGSGLFSLWAIFQVRVNLAMFGATITCSTVVIGWGLAQYPYLMPPYWTVSEAASPESVLELILIATAVGSVFLVPGLWLLFKIFKAEEVVEVN